MPEADVEHLISIGAVKAGQMEAPGLFSVYLDEPSLFDITDAIESNKGTSLDELVQDGRLGALHDLVEAKQTPFVEAIDATGANVFGQLQTVFSAINVSATREQVDAIAAIPGVKSIAAGPEYQLMLGDSVPHIGGAASTRGIGL